MKKKLAKSKLQNDILKQIKEEIHSIELSDFSRENFRIYIDQREVDDEEMEKIISFIRLIRDV